MVIGQILDKFLPISEIWIYSQIKGLEKLGVKSEIFCHQIINDDIFHHFPVYSYESSLFLKKFWFNRLSKKLKTDRVLLYWTEILKKRKIDLVHSQFGWPAKKGLALAKKKGIPFIVTFYGSDVTRNPIKKTLKFLEYRKGLPDIFDGAQKILCTSRFLKENLIQLGAPEEKVQIWHLGVDLGLFKKQPKESKKFKIVSCGRFVVWKGQKYLILALPKVLEKHSQVEVVFIGEGETLEECKRLVKKLNLKDKVIFRGKIPNSSDVAYEMATSDLIVHPSFTAQDGTNDACGMVLAEAGACQVPAVASRSGGICEVVQDEKTGFLVEEKNISQIAEKIITFIENENLRKKMGQAAQKYVQENFDLEKQTSELKKIYEQVIKK